MKYLKYYNQINEGNDGLILDISRDYINEFKKFLNSNESEFVYLTEDIEILIKVTTIKDHSNNYAFDNDAFIDWDDEEGISVLKIWIEVNPDFFPASYNDFIADFKECLKHELVHSTQKHTIKRGSGFFNEVTSPNEVSAYVRGFYKRAKTERKNIDVVIDQWIESRKNRFNNQGEMDRTREIFIEYAKSHLPRAKFSKNDY